MKLITMITTMAGPQGVRQAGTKVQVSDEEAALLVAAGAAKTITAGETAARAGGPEKAIVKKIPAKKAK